MATWNELEPTGRRLSRPGQSIVVPSERLKHATFSALLGDVLDNQHIRWARSDDDRIGFRIVLKDERGWRVRHRQTFAGPLRLLGVEPNTRLWFEFDEATARFVETSREPVDRVLRSVV